MSSICLDNLSTKFLFIVLPLVAPCHCREAFKNKPNKMWSDFFAISYTYIFIYITHTELPTYPMWNRDEKLCGAKIVFFLLSYQVVIIFRISVRNHYQRRCVIRCLRSSTKSSRILVWVALIRSNHQLKITNTILYRRHIGHNGSLGALWVWFVRQMNYTLIGKCNIRKLVRDIEVLCLNIII